ncbi:MAG: alpha/beta hydrolase [Desulfobulbaceae bacterium]|nr:alpha/beta hydrolase [Desulfobulbaceae bacterium]
MRIRVNNCSLFYEHSGDGPPLLLLHGNGEDHHIFDAASEQLRRDFTLYAIDSRNHGESEKTADYSYDAMAEDVRRFILALRLEQTRIVGFSDGAIVALLFAMRHSQLVSAMALLGVNLKPSDFTTENYRFLQERYAETRDPLVKMMLEQPNIELTDLRETPVPTLIIAAEHDLFHPEMFQNLAQTMPNARLQIVAGHTHDSYIAASDTWCPALREFFLHLPAQ